MTGGDDRTYEFRIAGHLDARWSAWFADLTIVWHADGTCTLTGEVADQAQLHGILNRLRDMGAILLSLRTLDEGGGLGKQVSDQAEVPVRGRGAPPLVDC